MSIVLPTQQQCLRALDVLLRRCDGVEAAMFALRDGRSYAERFRSALSVNKFAAMSSSLVALSNSVLREIASDTLNYLLIEGEGHKLVLCKVSSSKGALILSILARHEINLGLVLGLAKMCVKEVADAGQVASTQAS